MKKETILFSTFIFVCSLCFTQNKFIKKNRQELEKKFEYVLFNKDCSSAIVGTRMLGSSDGGGRIPKGVKDIQIATLNEKKIAYWTPGHTKVTTKTKSFSNDKYNLRLVSNNGKIGLIHPCKRIVLEPKYDYIGEFNQDGIAMALLGNNINIINLNGESLIKTVENLSFYDDGQNFPIPFKNTIITNNQDKSLYSIFNFSKNNVVTNNEYDYIYTDIIKADNKNIGFIAKKDGSETIIDDMGNEIMPLVFEKISGTVNNGSFVYGKLPNNEGFNIYDYSKKVFIVPIELQKEFNYGSHIGDGVWSLLFKDTSSNNTPINENLFSVYDTTNKRFILEPNPTNGSDQNWNQLKTINSKYISILDKEKNLKIFNRKNSDIVKQFPKGSRLKFLKLKKENIEKVFIVSSIQLDPKSSKTSCNLYTDNFEVIFENIMTYPSDIKSAGDYIYLKQNIDCYPCKTVYTAYDFDGKIIGEKHQFVPKK